MCDSPLYPVNKFYCHWLIKKLLWANGLTEERQAENPNNDLERHWRDTKRHHAAAKGERHQIAIENLTG